jgi:hypothetical protein
MQSEPTSRLSPRARCEHPEHPQETLRQPMPGLRFAPSRWYSRWSQESPRCPLESDSDPHTPCRLRLTFHPEATRHVAVLVSLTSIRLIAAMQCQSELKTSTPKGTRVLTRCPLLTGESESFDPNRTPWTGTFRTPEGTAAKQRHVAIEVGGCKPHEILGKTKKTPRGILSAFLVNWIVSGSPLNSKSSPEGTLCGTKLSFETLP